MIIFKIRDIENRLVIAKEEGSGRECNLEFGISRCKPVYTEWINNVLLYSTGNYTNILWLAIMEKNIYIIYICVCVFSITESICYRAVINTTL